MSDEGLRRMAEHAVAAMFSLTSYRCQVEDMEAVLRAALAARSEPRGAEPNADGLMVCARCGVPLADGEAATYDIVHYASCPEPRGEGLREADVDEAVLRILNDSGSYESMEAVRDLVVSLVRQGDAVATARLLLAATPPAPALDVLRQRAEAVVREYDKTHLTHDVAYEDVAEAIDWLRIALDPSHPMYTAVAPERQDG